MTTFADVILPIPYTQTFTYSLPPTLPLPQVGSSLRVPFGKRKVYTGILHRLHQQKPTHYIVKPIHHVLDHLPRLSPLQMRFLNWMSTYYMSPLGSLIPIFMPGIFQEEQVYEVTLNETYQEGSIRLTRREKEIITYLQKKVKVGYDKLARHLKKKNIFPLLKPLLKRGWVTLTDQFKQKYQPKTIRKIRLADKHLKKLFELKELATSLAKKPKQLEVLKVYKQIIQKKDSTPGTDYEKYWVNVKELAKDQNGKAAMKRLIKDGILIQKAYTTPHLEEKNPTGVAYTLSEKQEKCLQEMEKCFKSHSIVLLQGVTGSGKTAIYIQYIHQLLEKEKRKETQVLYLLPEIAMTVQVIEKLQAIFGEQVGIYHSRYSEIQKAEIWHKVANGKYRIIIGVRSSIFLPFQKLGLVIVDEEHEEAYKEYSTAPYYHAKDAVLILARYHGGKVILGSATPSVETYYMARQKQYGLCRLQERFAGIPLPVIHIIDMKEASKKKMIRQSFSKSLLDTIRKTLEKKKQVLIFQNRRGYGLYICCQDCGWIAKCKYCAVSLTYYQSTNLLTCHYCGYKRNPIEECSECKSPCLKQKGAGTEKILEELEYYFPEAKIKRMDSDTTRRKNSYKELIRDFEARKIDILIGTQMIIKGLDFPNLNLVGVVNLDMHIHFPDFRAQEKCFQLATQVSGRAGRKNEQGKVYLQCWDVTIPLLEKIQKQDYESMYQEEIKTRKDFGYPPYVRLIKIIMKHKKEALLQEASKILFGRLRTDVKEYAEVVHVLGPHAPLIPKIASDYLRLIWIKIKKPCGKLTQIKQAIQVSIEATLANLLVKHLKIMIDVDPIN